MMLRSGPEYSAHPEGQTTFALTEQEKKFLTPFADKISEEDVQTIKRIARVIGGDLNLKVALGKPGGGSFFDKQKLEITLDAKQVASDIAKARFVAAHEGAHRRLTKGLDTIGVNKDLINELYGEKIGFAYLANALEDPTVNSWAIKKFEGLKGDFDKVYQKMFADQHVPLGTDHPDAQRAIALTGTIPSFVWAGSELIRYWHNKRFSKDIKKVRPQVAKALGRVLQPAREVWRQLPQYAFNEKEVREKARDRFKIIYQKIWPEIEKLAAQDLKQEALRQMVQEQMPSSPSSAEGDRSKSSTKGDHSKSSAKGDLNQTLQTLKKGQSGSPLDQLDKKMRQELAKAIKESHEQVKEQLDSQLKNIKKQLKDISDKSGKKGKKGENSDKDQKAGKEKQAGKGEKVDESKKSDQDDKKKELKNIQGRIEDLQKKLEKGELMPLNEDLVSDKLKKALKDLYGRLPKKDKEDLAKRAKEQLAKIEDVYAKGLAAKLNKDRPPTHQEYKEQQKQQKEAANRQAAREKELAELKEQAFKLNEQAKSDYDKIREEVDPQIEDLYQRLEDYFIKERHPKWRKGYASGTRLTLFKAMQYASGAKPTAYREMFERKTLPKRFDYKFSLVVDVSYSMREEDKIQETRKGLIMLEEALDRLGIDNEVLIYNDEIGVHELKAFDQELDEKRGEIADLINAPDGDTPTAAALKESWRHIQEHAGRENYIVVLTDGEPHPEGPEPTKRLVGKILRDSTVPIKMIGVGLGRDTGLVKDLFPSAIGNVPAQKLPETLGSLLEDMITNPDKYNISPQTRQRFIG